MTAPEPIRHVAFIGLGHMGAPMAANLAARGFVLRVYDARRDAIDRFVSAHSAAAAASIAEAVRGAHAVITMLPDDAAVRAVMLDRHGVAGHAPAAAIAIDMGTSSPSATLAVADDLARAGMHYVDAPVMGGVAFARDGTLDVMAGGAPEVVERCLPVFAAVGRRTWRCGAVGSGHALKAIANLVNAATFVTLIEAMTIGRKFGLDTPLMTEALAALCAGRQYPLEKKIAPQVLTRRFATGMALGLIAKDLGIAASLGRDVGARSSIAEHTQALWREAVERYGSTRDQAEIARLWEDDAGVHL